MFDIDEKKIRFKLIAGRHRVANKIIMLGEIFLEYPSKVEWMSHRVERLDPLPAPPLRRTVSNLKKKHKGGGKYQVINTVTGEAINDRLLTSKEADELIGINSVKKGSKVDEEEKASE